MIHKLSLQVDEDESRSQCGMDTNREVVDDARSSTVRPTHKLPSPVPEIAAERELFASYPKLRMALEY